MDHLLHSLQTSSQYEPHAGNNYCCENIRNYFKTVTNSEMVGVKKPNPKIFNFALEVAKAKANESIMIGDSLEADIEGAHKVGMDTIHFDYNNENSNHNYKKVSHLKAIEYHL